MIPSRVSLQGSSAAKTSEKKTKKTEHPSTPFLSSFPEKESKEVSFQELLEQIAPSHKPQTKDIHELWKDLPQLERELIRTRSIEALENYKNQVRSLLGLILQKNVEYKKLRSPIPGTDQKREYTYLEYLDEKLKLLAEIISHPQNSAFQILKQMDNIKGFLIDLQR